MKLSKAAPTLLPYLLFCWILGLFAAYPSSAADTFDFLQIEGNTVATTHNLKRRIAINEQFEALGELHHTEASNGLLFEVSFAAFSNKDNIILIHAEALREKSGVLNYSHLPQVRLNKVSFGMREQCIPKEAAGDLETNHQAQFVKSKGFHLKLPFLLTQFLKASEDGNAEIAISYGRPVENCAEISERFRTETRALMNSNVLVE